MNDAPATALRDSGLRVTRQRLAVIAALVAEPHAGADVVLRLVRREVGQVSTQAVYDVLNNLLGSVRNLRQSLPTSP